MTDYRDAVKALASSISSNRTGLSDEKKMEIARSILAREGLETDRRDIKIEFSDEKNFQIMRDYLGSLERARRAELGKNIEASIDNAKRLTALRDELREDLSEAYDEDRELEGIARKLQDRGLGKLAGKEEDQINRLGASLEELAEKGQEVDRLEETLENILRDHGLEKEGLDEELRKRASKVSRLIEDYSGGSDVDLDSVVEAIAEENEILERANSRSRASLKDDLEKLSELYGHKDRESMELDNIEEALRERRLEDAETSLDLILADRKIVLRGEASTLKELHRDLEDSLEIASGLEKFFRQIDIVESRDDINENEFYTKLAEKLGFPDSVTSKQFTGKLRKDYGSMRDELEKIEDLRDYSLERDKANYEKIKQIDQEDSKLRREASSTEAKQKLRDIHEKLQRLGYDLKNEISIESGGEASDTFEGSEASDAGLSGPYGGKYGVPESGKPWIVSVSDVESDYTYLKRALRLLEDHGWAPIVTESGDYLEWAGNNYRFILNGDLLDRGDNPVSVWKSVFNLFGTGRAEMTMGNHDRPILIPKARIKKEQRVHSTAIGEGLPEFPPAGDEVELASLIYDADNGDISRDFGMKRQFAEAIMNDNIKMMAEGYHYFYVHGGARYASQDKMKQANSALKKLVAEPILEDISNGSRSNEEEINERISRRDGRYQMLFGVGDDSTRDETAGMTWMSWKSIPENAGNQIVGHKGVDEPSIRNEGQIINENTSGKSGKASIVVETPEGAFALVEGKSNPINLKGYESD